MIYVSINRLMRLIEKAKTSYMDFDFLNFLKF